MTRPDIVIGSVLKVLNDSSLLEDPLPGRNGSFFLGPNQTLNYQKAMPKGFVSIDSVDTDEQSFGNGFKRSKGANVMVSFYTSPQILGSGTTANLKENELIYAYMDLIEQSLIDNQDTIGFPITGIGTFDTPVRFRDQNTLVGFKSFTFEYRK